MAVIHDFIAGNEEAFRLLYDENVDKLRHFTSGYVRDYSVVQDIVQEAFVALWEHRRSLKNTDSVKSFLFTVARNRCLNYLRSAAVRKNHSEKILPVGDDSNILEKTIESEFFDMLFALYEDLPPSLKRVYALNLEGKTNNEIALALDIPVATVKKYKVRANRIMRSRITDLLLAIVSVHF